MNTHNLKNVHLVNFAYSKCFFFLNIMSASNKKYNFVINFTIQRKNIVFVCLWREGGLFIYYTIHVYIYIFS